MPKSKLTHTQARRLLTLYRASGLSQPAFCLKHRVGPSLFSYWPQKLHFSAALATPRFQEVILPPTTLSKDTCLRSLPSCAKLEFPAVFFRDTLTWLTAKEAAC